MLDLNAVIDITTQYGFCHEETRDNICIFTFNSGPFINALIIPLTEKVETDSIKSEYSGAGYTCEVRLFPNEQSIESYLFKEIFNIDVLNKRNISRYEKFTKAKADLFDDSQYSYINPKYSIDRKSGTENVVSEIYDKLPSNRPTLFLVEAAAGFGKTCSAFELLRKISSSGGELIPLLSELSKNRQAKIFRYVLLDEIANSFQSISYPLVIKKIKEGKIPVVLDGFDELLHENKADEGYEQAESMLDTIGEFLTGQAKVILTTRKSVIFDGDEFNNWVTQHEDVFDIIRIEIDEPSIDDWLPPERLKELEYSEFKIKNISNPVLLSYLRSINSESFKQAINSSTEIVEKYFKTMLEREQFRQDLKMTVEEQQTILKVIAKDMLDHDYTSESRSYIIDLIENKELPLLTKIQSQYTNPKISIDELSNKLASHALLDRNTDDDKSIGFVNEFVLGHFCSEVLVRSEVCEDFIFETRFIQPTVLAYENSSKDKKQKLWDALNWSLEYEKIHNVITYSIILFNEVRINIIEDSVENLSFNNIVFGENQKIFKSSFVGCNFDKVEFNTKNIDEVTFINCKLYNCFITDPDNMPRNITFINCTVEPEMKSNIDEKFLSTPVEAEFRVDDEITLSDCDVFILSKFWPIGGGFYKHRAIKGLLTKNSQFSYNELVYSIDKLKKIDYLTIPTKRSFLELNQTYAVNIRRALDNAASK